MFYSGWMALTHAEWEQKTEAVQMFRKRGAEEDPLHRTIEQMFTKMGCRGGRPPALAVGR
jgi:hypothetical protein